MMGDVMTVFAPSARPVKTKYVADLPVSCEA